MKAELIEEAESTVTEVQKSQAIRLADVFLIAPYLIYLSTKKNITTLDSGILILLGVSTLLYNGMNYLNNKK